MPRVAYFLSKDPGLREYRQPRECLQCCPWIAGPMENHSTETVSVPRRIKQKNNLGKSQRKKKLIMIIPEDNIINEQNLLIY